MTELVPQFPMHIESSCLINTVSAHNRQPNIHYSEATIETPQHSYTYFKANHFKINIPKDVLNSDNLTLKQGHLGFTKSQRSTTQCVIFILLTTSFTETHSVIQYSGFSTSDEVVFLINLDFSAGAQVILYSFSKLIFLSKLEPFHAPLLSFER